MNNTMTIDDFMNNFNLKSKKQVIKWIENDLIPGTEKDPQTSEYFIPECARPPYTQARAKTATAIYKSMVSACIKRRGICAKLYHISDAEFSKYVNDLSEYGYIDIKTYNGIPCYYATLKSQDFMSSKPPIKFMQSCVSVVSEAIAKGTVSAFLEKS